MDVQEAEGLLKIQVDRLKKMPYTRLTGYMGGAASALSYEGRGASGMEYDFEVESMWEEEEGGDIRVQIVIFEKTMDCYTPISYAFIMNKDGAIVKEGFVG
ncbi:MAG: hypothetical protein OEV59_05500 [Deltaproteobacteria bacterium]|nr:hypothetical protein [Deltaproteobacteria bacterium]